MTTAWRWLRVVYHRGWVAFWEYGIPAAREDRDWEYLGHAIDERDRHEDAIALIEELAATSTTGRIT